MRRKSASKFDGSGRETESGTGVKPSRRRVLKTAGVVGVSTLTIPGLASASTEEGTSSDDTPDWLIVHEENGVDIEAGEVETITDQNGEVQTLDHNNEHLKLDATVNAFGVEFGITFEHWAGTCEWKSEWTVLGQSFTTGRKDDCSGVYDFSLNAGLAKASYTVDPEPIAPGVDRMDKVTYSGSVEVYDPRHGWRKKSFEFDFDIEEALN